MPTTTTLQISPVTNDQKLSFSVFDMQRGLLSASDPVEVQVFTAEPRIKSAYPTILPSYKYSENIRVILQNIGDNVVGFVQGRSVSLKDLDFRINVSSTTQLDQKNTAYMLALPPVAPGEFSVVFNNGMKEIANFSLTIYDRTMPSVGLVTPTSVKVGDSPQLISVFLSNFPTSICGATAACFEQTLDLQVSCLGKKGHVESHSEPNGLLMLEIIPPAFTQAGQIQCTVSAFVVTGKKISASFGLYYQAVATIIPIDAPTTGGTLLTVSALGFGMGGASDPSLVSVLLCGKKATIEDVLFDVESTMLSVAAYAPAQSMPGTCEGSISIAGYSLTCNFLFNYFGAPIGEASPARAAQDGSTATGEKSLEIALTNFPPLGSLQDITVGFGSQTCDDLVCSVESFNNFATLSSITVTIPVCVGPSAIDISVVYVGNEAVPAGFDPLGNYTFAKRAAIIPFTYYQKPLQVVSIFYCDLCNEGYCLQNGLCHDFRQPLVGAAPAGGSGRLTLYLDGAFGHGGVQSSVSDWTISVAFGDSPAVNADTAYLLDGSLIAVESELTEDGPAGDMLVTLSVLSSGSSLVRSAIFSMSFFSPNIRIECFTVNGLNSSAGCQGTTGAQQLVRIAAKNLPVRSGSTLSDAGADVQVVFDGIPIAFASVTALEGSSAIIEFLTQQVTGPSRSVLYSVSLRSQPSAFAVGIFSIVMPTSVVSARFEAVLTSVLIAFDSPTSRCVSCGNDCSCIFKDSTAVLLAGPDSRASCVWTADGSLSVVLGAGASLIPGDNLVFDTCLTGADGRQLPYPLGAIVAAPAIPTAPTISLNGPSSVDPCSPLELVATAYSPRDLVYMWSCTNDMEVDAILNLVSGSRLSFAAGTSELPITDKTYEIRVRAVDFIGTSSPWATLSVYKSARASPQVQFSIPIVQVILGQDVTLEGQAVFSLCPTPRTQLKFSWSQTGGAPLGKAADLVGTSQPQILIPGSALKAGGQYRFALQVTSSVDASSLSLGSCVVLVQRQPLNAVIAGGTSLQRSAAAPIFLDASGSQDPSSSSTSAGMSFTWTCKVLAGSLLSQCRTIDGSPIVLNSSATLVR